jgi:hypothetical protein
MLRGLVSHTRASCCNQLVPLSLVWVEVLLDLLGVVAVDLVE